MDSVSKAAYSMIEEVRRQFRTIPGIMEGTGKPDYKSCVAISTTSALKEMLVPGVMAVLAPLVVGLLLGTGALGGMLAGALVTGKMDAPAGSMILGSPAKVVRPLTEAEIEGNRESARGYLHAAELYRKG